MTKPNQTHVPSVVPYTWACGLPGRYAQAPTELLTRNRAIHAGKMASSKCVKLAAAGVDAAGVDAAARQKAAHAGANMAGRGFAPNARFAGVPVSPNKPAVWRWKWCCLLGGWTFGGPLLWTERYKIKK